MRFGEWHTLRVETVATGRGWGCRFDCYLGGERVCEEPPDLWDGDDRYNLIWRAVEINPFDGANRAVESIVARVDNFYAAVLEASGQDS